MLTAKDIDIIKQQSQDGPVEMYYVCDYNETRDNSSDSDYKTIHKYKVLKVKVADVLNGYREYLDFVNNPSNYHIEQETEYYDNQERHSVLRKYNVRNTQGPYEKDFNPRIPCRIFGEYKTYHTDDPDHEDVEYIEESVVTPYFTNAFEFAGRVFRPVDYESNEMLQWKYIKLPESATVDGIEYDYVYSDYYILITTNFPTVEYPLVCARDKNCPFFRTLEDAWEFVKQCEA